MMAYDNQFVICVLHNGRVLRESNRGMVHIPYNGQYKIRLKNKHTYLRAKARVSVDGRSVSNLGDFILQAGETLDLERFLDYSMSEGSRFKFVPLSDERVLLDNIVELLHRCIPKINISYKLHNEIHKGIPHD